MGPTLGSIAVELVVGLSVLFIVVKMLGPTQVGQVTPFHFIAAILLGELVGNAVYQPETGVGFIVFSIALTAGVLILLEWTSLRFSTTRATVQGNPEVVIRRGLVQRGALARKRINLNELQGLLRRQGAFSIREVEYAILEIDGSLSVLPKPAYASPRRQDLNIPPREAHLPIFFIADGQVQEDNLKEAGFDTTWLRDQLAAQGVQDISQIFYAEWEEGEGLLVQRYGQESLPLAPDGGT